MKPGAESVPIADAEPAQSPTSLRRAFIEGFAGDVGRTWAESYRNELVRERRAVAGGWPGTVREARARVEHALAPELRRRRMHVLAEPERELAARAVYASARAEWLRHAEPEDP